MQNTKVIFSKELANKLVNAGFELIKTEINLKDPKFRVFVFVCTPELEAFVQAYKENK